MQLLVFQVDLDIVSFFYPATVTEEHENLLAWLQNKLRSNLLAIRKERTTDEPMYFSPSLRVYCRDALSQFDCYKAFQKFWMGLTQHRLPTVTPLQDVVSLLHKHGVDCDAVGTFLPLKVPNLLTLEDVHMAKRESMEKER
uniref:Uncharacterized protein n=1 Tax=Paramoeba aestuarina TaxID=180227 RepID=A0A7S4PNB1_9EUKA|mmetsp:Transcript_8622/g.13090  ORF Transcript_8622/g.13090 Transcript_8622/m.13090 type:complete len:141 (+) Transcript_8622:126-548(+)